MYNNLYRKDLVDLIKYVKDKQKLEQIKQKDKEKYDTILKEKHG